METNSSMITNISPENIQATIVTPINIPIVQNIPLTNPVDIQQEQIHIQTQVQEYQRKDAMSTRVIDETILRIYFPRTSDVEATIPIGCVSSSRYYTATTFVSQEKAINIQGPRLFLITRSPSLDMFTRFYVVYLQFGGLHTD